MQISGLSVSPAVLIVAGLVICLALAAGIGFFLYHRFGRRVAQYFIAGITPEQLALLDAACILREPGSLGDRAGILIRLNLIQDVCRALGRYLLTEIPTDNRLVSEALLREEKAEDPAFADFSVSRNGVPAIVSRLLREILLPAVGMNINVYIPSRSVVEPIDDGEFYVLFNAVPRGTNYQHVDSMFGYAVHERVLAPCGLGLPLVDQESGYVYGEVVGNCLYIHHNACQATGVQVAVLVKLLEQAARAGLNPERMIASVVASIPQDGLAQTPKQPVKQTGFTHHRRKLAVTLVREILAHALDRPIVLHECRGNAQASLKDDDFHIFHNARPRRLKSTAELPTGSGIPVMAEPGWLDGELIGNALYLYSDILGYGCINEATQFAALLLNARRQILISRLPEMAGILTAELANECLRAREVCDSEELPGLVQETEEALSQALTEARKSEHEVVRVRGHA